MKGDKDINLEKYSKEVLIEYIRQNCLYSIDQIERVSKDLEFEKLVAESENINKKMSKLKGIEHIKEYCKLMDKDREINKKIDKILGLDKEEGA